VTSFEGIGRGDRHGLLPYQTASPISQWNRRKHGGSSGIGNLAYACILCNRYKGTDIASIDHSGRPIRLFDPRRDSWDEHFKLDGPIIQPLTPVGEVTARMLRLNTAERFIERRLFQALGSYRNV
jgi:hypothetical protein